MSTTRGPGQGLMPLSLGMAVIRPGERMELTAYPQRPVRLWRLVVTAMPMWEDVAPELYPVIRDAELERDEYRDAPQGEDGDWRALRLLRLDEHERRVKELWAKMPHRQRITPDAVIEDVIVGVVSQFVRPMAITAAVLAPDSRNAARVDLDLASAGTRITLRVRSTGVRAYEFSAVFFCEALA